jgi:hypothetical protein
VLFPWCDTPSFTPIQNNRLNYGFVHFNLYIPRQQNGWQKTLLTSNTLRWLIFTNIVHYTRPDVLTAMKILVLVFWAVSPYELVCRYSEDGGNIFLRNASTIYISSRRYNPKYQHRH